MEQKKIPFFVRLKRAIINFDEYRTFSEEKTWTSVKYFLKLMIIFTVIITIALTIRVVNQVNVTTQSLRNDFPEFSFQNNTLVLEGETTRIVKGDSNGYFGIIIDSKENDLNNIDEAGDYQRIIAFLKDKMVVRDTSSVETSMTYEQLSSQYDLSLINKTTMLEILSRK